MKHGNSYFMQVSRKVWGYPLSDKAKLLFFWLNELEQRYTGEDVDYFYRTDADLATDMGWSLKTLKAAKAELRETELIQLLKINWVDPKTGKKSEKRVTGYRILA